MAIFDYRQQPIWSQPRLMCFVAFPPADLQLAPRQTLSGGMCFRLSPAESVCQVVALPAGTYRMGGTFHQRPLPKVAFRVR